MLRACLLAACVVGGVDLPIIIMAISTSGLAHVPTLAACHAIVLLQYSKFDWVPESQVVSPFAWGTSAIGLPIPGNTACACRCKVVAPSYT
jgi:hypothetical protein